MVGRVRLTLGYVMHATHDVNERQKKTENKKEEDQGHVKVEFERSTVLSFRFSRLQNSSPPVVKVCAILLSRHSIDEVEQVR